LQIGTPEGLQTLVKAAAEQGWHEAVLGNLQNLRAAVDKVATALPPPLEFLTIESWLPFFLLRCPPPRRF
jgi:hypothetical protein